MTPFIGPIFELITTVIDRLVPDKAAAEKAKLDMAVAIQSQEFQIQLEQIKVNAVEAASPSVLTSGWRPFIGWICGAGLAYVSILEPVLRFIAQVGFDYDGEFPVIDNTFMMQVLLGMLGLLGTMRTVEKVTHTEGNR